MSTQGRHTAARLLARVVDHYLGSGDFNGLRVDEQDRPWLRAAVTLIRRGSIEVIAEVDFPNPSVRPWHSSRSLNDQETSLRAALRGEGPPLCLYPMPTELEQLPAVREIVDEPYRQRLAGGAGGLDLAYFRIDVLEPYRNDPTFRFDFTDFGVQTSLTDDAYLDESTPEHERVLLHYLGFAYLQPVLREGPIRRSICGFVRDLSRLTAVHQQRWRTYELPASSWEPHPVWWQMMMGHWPDGRGPFEAFLNRLETWNELHERAFGTPLLRSVERPREFGWVLRPSQKEYDDFVQQLDKLLSENLRHEAFDVADIPRLNAKNQQHGTLTRLNLLLEKTGVDGEARTHGMHSLREVRSARSKPAHAIRQNINDASFVHRQAQLLSDLTQSIDLFVALWRRHQANRDWSPGDDGAKYYWL